MGCLDHALLISLFAPATLCRCSISDWKEEQALALAKVAISLMATKASARRSVVDIIGDLEGILLTSVKGIVAPQGMQYDPETGELISGASPPRPTLRAPLRFDPDTGEPTREDDMLQCV
jgi:hypothetical protein